MDSIPQSAQRPLLVECSKPERTIPSAAPRQRSRRARGLSKRSRRRGRPRVEHDRPRARPGRAARRRRVLALNQLQRLVVSERGEAHTRGGGEPPFFVYLFPARVPVRPLQPRRWTGFGRASLEVLRASAHGRDRPWLCSALIREASRSS